MLELFDISGRLFLYFRKYFMKNRVKLSFFMDHIFIKLNINNMCCIYGKQLAGNT